MAGNGGLSRRKSGRAAAPVRVGRIPDARRTQHRKARKGWAAHLG